MMKQGATARLKGHLAMAAFVIVATTLVLLTAVGVLNYATLPVDAQVNRQQANGPSAPVGSAATAAGAFIFSEK